MWRPILPPPSPPFHQISLPALPAPAKKLHAVRLSMLTPLAFQARIPLRPSGLPSEPFTPKSWFFALRLHFGEPGFVPSTTTFPRFIPRRWIFDFVMIRPAGVWDGWGPRCLRWSARSW